MEEEWHVSDSEEEDDVTDIPKIINTSLERLSTLSQNDPNTHSDRHSIPRNLISLYERISNEGFIALHCQAKRPLESRSQDGTENISAVDDNKSPLIVNEDNIVNTKRKPSANEFDYEEEIFETTVVFPRRAQKSGIDKFKRTKRVGSMENVIHDLNRFKELNAKERANQTQQ